jgi:hypothetical protein
VFHGRTLFRQLVEKSLDDHFRGASMSRWPTFAMFPPYLCIPLKLHVRSAISREHSESSIALHES